MTEIYVNHLHKKGIIIPCKCGSSAFGNMLFMQAYGSGKRNRHWEQFQTRQEQRLAKDVITSNNLSNYDFIGIARNPVDWYISGFRFVQQCIKDGVLTEPHNYWHFPTVFRQHLELVDKLHTSEINDGEYDEWWLDHCMLNPYMHFTENTQVIDLGDWNKIRQWFDTFYKLKHEFAIVNKTSDTIPYPVLDYNEIFLLRKLHSNFWHLPKIPSIYNIDKSIKNYILKR